jgi:hypothetical protein
LIDSDLISSLSTLLIGVLGAVTALVLALKRRATEEELPQLRDRVKELEVELVEARREILNLDRRCFGLERLAHQNDLTIPAHLQRTSPVRPVRDTEAEG